MKFEEKREKSGRPAVVAFATKTRGEAGGGMNIQGGTRNPPEADKCRIRRRRTSVESAGGGQVLKADPSLRSG